MIDIVAIRNKYDDDDDDNDELIKNPWLALQHYSVCALYAEVDLPVQVNPSPVYPVRQLQVKLPTELLQLASELHPPLFVAHSSISVTNMKHTGDCVRRKWNAHCSQNNMQSILSTLPFLTNTRHCRTYFTVTISMEFALK